MFFASIIICVALLSLVIFFIWTKRTNAEGELVRHSISPEELHALMTSSQKVLLFDVRQALDLLAYPEQIPGGLRIPPDEVLTNPAAIPKDKDVVFYCTCPGDKTSRMVLHQVRAVGFSRVKFLTGGLAAWKGMGFPVEPFPGTITFTSIGSARSIV